MRTQNPNLPPGCTDADIDRATGWEDMEILAEAQEENKWTRAEEREDIRREERE
jgi:hypothetical protein